MTSVSSFSWRRNSPPRVRTGRPPSPAAAGHRGGVHGPAAAHHAAVHVGAQASFPIRVLDVLRRMPRSGIAGSYNSSGFCFFRGPSVQFSAAAARTRSPTSGARNAPPASPSGKCQPTTARYRRTPRGMAVTHKTTNDTRRRGHGTGDVTCPTHSSVLALRLSLCPLGDLSRRPASLGGWPRLPRRGSRCCHVPGACGAALLCSRGSR